MKKLRKHTTLDDLFLNVFVIVDDWLKVNQTRFSCHSETLTIPTSAL